MSGEPLRRPDLYEPYVLGEPGLDVYPVGALADAWHVWAVLQEYGPARAWRVLRYRARTVTRSRSWRRRSFWNGYLAEPYWWPAGVAKCGRGWTRRGAVRSLNRHVAAYVRSR